MSALALKLSPEYLCSNKFDLAFDQRPQREREKIEEEKREHAAEKKITERRDGSNEDQKDFLNFFKCSHVVFIDFHL